MKPFAPLVLAVSVAAVSALSGCAELGLARNEVDPNSVRLPEGAREEPPRVVVRHVLLSFDEAKLPGVTRPKAEAERVARQVFELAKSGRDFGQLVRSYTDDRHGDGSYALANWGVTPEGDELPREGMARAFGRMAFSLQPGQVGIVPWHASDSPFGWHVVRRER